MEVVDEEGYAAENNHETICPQPRFRETFLARLGNTTGKGMIMIIDVNGMPTLSGSSLSMELGM